jgi:hypothetical protein
MNSINSFSSLLLQGQITEALQLRLEAIEQKARHYRQDLEAAKVSSAALGVVGLLLSANPLVAVIAGCGLAGYGWTVLRDYQNTKRLCLLPLVRKGTGELLTVSDWQQLTSRGSGRSTAGGHWLCGTGIGSRI